MLCAGDNRSERKPSSSRKYLSNGRETIKIETNTSGYGHRICHLARPGLGVVSKDFPEEVMIHLNGDRDFPGGAVVKNPPANAGDTGSSPGLGGSHMPRSN